MQAYFTIFYRRHYSILNSGQHLIKMKLYLPNVLKLLQCRTKSFIQRNLFTLGPFKCTVIILQSITNKLHNSLQNFINSSCLFSVGQNTITTNIFSIVENNKSLCKERYKIDYTTQIFELIHQQFKALFHKFLSIIFIKSNHSITFVYS